MFELLLYRICLPALRGEADRVPRWLAAGLDLAARFAHNLAAVLAVAVLPLGLTMAAVRLSRNLPGRLALLLVGVVYVPLCGAILAAPELLAARHEIGRAYLLLQVCFVTLAALIGLLVLPLPAPRRVKLAVAALVLPALIHFEVVWRLAVGAVSEPGLLEVLGQWVAVAAAGLCPLLIPVGTGRRGVVLAAGCATAVFLVCGGLLLLDVQLAARLLYHALGLELPAARGLQVAYLISLLSFSFTAAYLLCQPGHARVRGAGLLLIGVAGYAAQDAYLLCLPLLGLLAIARSTAAAAQDDLAPHGPTPVPEV